MGLDMYLKAKKYISEHFDKETFEKVNSLNLGQKNMKVNEVVAEAMYWRKANAIHDWFVRECQGGIDECQETYVKTEDLKRLRDLCREVLSNKKKAEKLLPTKSGFFFGDVNYDEWYLDYVQNTETGLSKILEDEELTNGWDFYYQSSW